MKRLLLLLFTFLCACSGQLSTKEIVLKHLKDKQTAAIQDYCELPLKLDLGPAYPKEIRDYKTLKAILDKLVTDKNYEAFFRKGMMEVDAEAVVLTVRSYNEQKELESESALVLSFRKGKDGVLKLYQIIMAG